jgi:hypothetical protein
MNPSHNDLRFHGHTLAGPGQLDFAVNVAPGSPPDWLREALHGRLNAIPSRVPARASSAVWR